MWVEALERSSQPTTFPTWADGTDEEIAEALTRHYNNEIDLTDYWTVGDERVVHLSAIEATSDYDAQPEQDITLVLVNAGGRTLTTPINGHTECAFVVGQKDCLSAAGRFSNDAYGWINSLIRTWLNDNYINALPATLSGIFKSHAIPYCLTYNTTTVNTDYSIVGLPARTEILGKYDSYDKAYSSYNQLAYYQDSSNRVKIGGSGGATSYKNYYWTNSKRYSTSSSYNKKIFSITSSGASNNNLDSSTYLGIAPQMVI